MQAAHLSGAQASALAPAPPSSSQASWRSCTLRSARQTAELHLRKGGQVELGARGQNQAAELHICGGHGWPPPHKLWEGGAGSPHRPSTVYRRISGLSPGSRHGAGRRRRGAAAGAGPGAHLKPLPKAICQTRSPRRTPRLVSMLASTYLRRIGNFIRFVFLGGVKQGAGRAEAPAAPAAGS